MKTIQVKLFPCILFSLILLQSFTTNEIVSVKKDMQVPVFVDIKNFTFFWTKDIEIKRFFVKNKNLYSDQSVVFFYKFGNDHKPYSIDTKENLIGFERFSQRFCQFRWKFQNWKKFNQSVQNIRVTILSVSDQNYVQVSIDIVDRYSVIDKILRYKTVYTERKNFNI